MQNIFFFVQLFIFFSMISTAFCLVLWNDIHIYKAENNMHIVHQKHWKTKFKFNKRQSIFHLDSIDQMQELAFVLLHVFDRMHDGIYLRIERVYLSIIVVHLQFEIKEKNSKNYISLYCIDVEWKWIFLWKKCNEWVFGWNLFFFVYIRCSISVIGCVKARADLAPKYGVAPMNGVAAYGRAAYGVAAW